MRDFQKPGRSEVFAANGMCATSHPLAAKVAIQILESGGNAVDAAIAAGVLLGICEPQSTGIGGDCFVLLSPGPGKDIIALNGSGRAPAGLDPQNLRKKGMKKMPVLGVDSVTIPGAVDAFCRLSSDWGKIGLKASLAPAIHYAETGVPVAARASFDWATLAPDLKGMARNDYLVNGVAPRAGHIFRAPKQAEALRRVALEGRAGFYEGEVAQDLVRSLNALGGTHTLDDFAATACDYTTPVSGHYKGRDLVEHPPNGQGATAILMNNILAQFDLPTMDPWGSQRAHIEAEAAKLAYDARNRFIADPDHTLRLDHLLAPETGARLAELIDPKHAMKSPPALSEQVHRDTVYLTVVDRDLMAVSFIYSIYYGFGSCMSSDQFGIIFQNRGAGFTLEAGHPNEAGPGKRPMHTIIPGMLCEDGLATVPFGVMGGAYQPNGHHRFMSNLLDFDCGLQAALDAPRSFADEGKLKVERGYSDKTRRELVDMGHVVEIPEGPLGGGQAIRINHETGVFEGASDPRKDGCALGY